MRALVVDDDAAVRRILSRCLSLWGWEVVECPSVAAAMAAFPNARPRLAVCDADLPDGDGVALAQILHQADPALSVVMVSGNPANLERARQSGLPAGLQKPFEAAELLLLIQDGHVSPD